MRKPSPTASKSVNKPFKSILGEKFEKDFDENLD